MNKTLLGLAMCATAPFAAGADSVAESQQIRRANSQASVAGPEDYFSGQVRVDPLFPATDELSAEPPS